MKEVFKIIVNIIETVIAFMVISVIILSNNERKEKIISSISFLLLYLIILYFGNDCIHDLEKRLYTITSSLNLLKVLSVSITITFIIAVIILPFIILQGSKPILIAVNNGVLLNLVTLLFTLLFYIFPVIFLVVSILYNARVKDLTVIFATLTFLGVLITNGKKVYIWIRKKLNWF
jgi:hypothetical protein